jgi:hypothetical protein
MIIDSHLHIDLRGFTEQKLLNHLSRNKIEKAWLLSWEEKNPQFEGYSPVSHERILEICSKYPGKFIPFYAPDPNREDLDEKLDILNNNGFKGVGELKVAMFWEDKAIERLLKGIRKNILIFHMQDKRYYSSSLSVRQKLIRDYKNERFKGGIKKLIEKVMETGKFKDDEKKIKYFPGYLPDFKGLENRLIQFPGINFVAHGWLFWSNISSDYSLYNNLEKSKIRTRGIIWTLLEKHPNLYCDISAGSGWNALTRDKKHAREFLESFSEKILFGTDNTSFEFVDMIKSYKLPKAKEEMIFFGNAEKLLQ